MIGFVYKSLKKSDTYLFVKNKDSFEDVPQALRQLLGKLEYVMEIDLDKRDKLAYADPQEVSAHLQQSGFYLQLPPATVFYNS
jgi:uncharacterized protein YcgL (UPF0745 family)